MNSEKRISSGTYEPDELVPNEPHRIECGGQTYLVSDILSHSTDESGTEQWTVAAVPVPPAQEFTIRIDRVARTWQIEEAS